MKKIMLAALVASIASSSFAQTRMWVFLADKGANTQAKLQQPARFLSEKALENRKEKGIALTEEDLPVLNEYVTALNRYDCKVLSTSRWLNAVAVEIPQNCEEEVRDLCFVTGIKPIQSLKVARENHLENGEKVLASYLPISEKKQTGLAFDYGEGFNQAEMLKVPALHKKGITGKGVRIAVFDAGFAGADTIDVFKHLWKEKRVLAMHDFVDNDDNVFSNDDHGTEVLSTIAANLPGEMVGIAPDATFILGRTEQSASETQREEHNWVKAVEWADSIGVDVIHSSLGYTKFDDGVGSYTYQDMNGNTAVTSRAADKAAKKGILLTVSAGNEGSNAWKYIAAPSDADSILCVGAVNKSGKIASFSSRGPSSDGQVKPDVMAVGANATVWAPDNHVTTANGTSFSGPIMAGFEVLLKQANPKRTNMEIIQATRLSGDQYNFPDNDYGYGIPNVLFADSLLKNVKDLSTVKINMTAKPSRDAKPKAPTVVTFTANPKTELKLSGNSLSIKSPEGIQQIEIRKENMRVLLNNTLYKVNSNDAQFDISPLEKGEHYLHIKTASYEENIKFSKG